MVAQTEGVTSRWDVERQLSQAADSATATRPASPQRGDISSAISTASDEAGSAKSVQRLFDLLAAGPVEADLSQSNPAVVYLYLCGRTSGYLGWATSVYVRRPDLLHLKRRGANPSSLVSDSDEVIWKSIRRTWQASRRGFWKYVPFWGAIDVKEVKIRFVARDVGRVNVQIRHLDIAGIKEDCNHIRQQHEYTEQEVAEQDICDGRYDELGEWKDDFFHNEKCMEFQDFNFGRCRARHVQDACERLHKIDLRGSLKDAFDRPHEAWKQATLAGYAQDSCLIRACEEEDRTAMKKVISKSDKLLGHLDDGFEHRALYIDVGWQIDAMKRDVPALFFLTMLIVVIWKVTTGDWNVAAAFGSLLVGFVTMLLARRECD